MLATWMPKDSRQGPSRTSYSIVILSSYGKREERDSREKDKAMKNAAAIALYMRSSRYAR